VTKCRAIDAYRRLIREENQEQTLRDLVQRVLVRKQAESSAHAMEEVVAMELKHILNDIIASLPKRQRQICEAYFSARDARQVEHLDMPSLTSYLWKQHHVKPEAVRGSLRAAMSAIRKKAS